MKNEPFIITQIQDMAYVAELVNSFFQDDKKTTIWLNTENPLLGNQIPMDMIFAGRTEKLVNFIKDRQEGNTL